MESTMSSLQYELKETGDMGTKKLLEQSSPKQKVSRLYELFMLSFETEYEGRAAAVKRHVRYLCAAVEDLEADHVTGLGFKTLTKAYTELQPVSLSMYTDSRVVIVRNILW